MTGFNRSLDVNGEIRAVHGHDVVLLTARRDMITIDIPRLRGLLGSFRRLGGKDRRTKSMAAVAAGLDSANLTLRFRMADKTVAKLGAEAHPGPLSRLVGILLGVSPLEIRPTIIPALFQFRSP